MIILLLLISFTETQTPIEFELNDDLGNQQTFINEEDGRPKLFPYKVRVKTNDFSYYILRTYESDGEVSESPMHLFYHKDNVASPENFERSSALYHYNIIGLSKNIGDSFYISVYCPGRCKGALSYYASNYIHLNPNDHFEFIGGTNYTLAIKKKNFVQNDSLQVVLLGQQNPINEEYMQFGIFTEDGQNMIIIDDERPVKGLFIRDCELSYNLHPNKGKFDGAKYILVRVGGPEGMYMRFTSRQVGEGVYYVGDPAIYSIKGKKEDFFQKECIHILGKLTGAHHFKIVTSTALSIEINDGVYTDVIGYMENFDYIYDAKNEGGTTKFCFRSNETSYINGNDVETEKQAFHFQIVLSGIGTLSSILEPLYEGWVYKDILEEGESRFYRHAKWTPYKTNVFIMSTGGTLNAYQVKCPTFPYCTSFDKYQNITKLIYAFSAFVGTIEPRDETHIGDPVQMLHVVKCMEKDGCFIRIEYVDQLTRIRLRENENHGKFVDYHSTEDYSIFPYTDNRNNKFEISLDVFAGDAVLNIESKLDSYTYKYIFFGSSEKYIFEYKDQEIQEINFSVDARKNTYYVVSYRQITTPVSEFRIGESGILLQAIKGTKDSKRNYRFWHNSPNKENAIYVVNFIPLNCQVKVSRNYENFDELSFNNIDVKKNKLGQFEDIIDKNDNEYKILSPRYTLEFNNFNYAKPNDEYCLFFVGASESTSELPTLLRENAAYSRTLNSKSKKAYFVWSFPYISGDADIYVVLHRDVRLKALITLNDNNSLSEFTFSKTTLLEIPSSYLYECQHIQGCPILLEIKFQDDVMIEGDYLIEVSLSTQRKTPSLLQKGTLRKGGMNANATAYYYIRVDKDEEGEIIADFKRGSPRLFAKMILNNQNDGDSNAWARKSVLPTKNNYDRNLAYDPTTQKIRYGKAQTGKCDDGCIIVFGIATGDNYTDYQNLFTYEYNIMSRYIKKDNTNLEKFAINIPINEFIVGALQEVNYYDTYILDIDNRMDGIEIEFKSESAMMTVSWNENDFNNGCKINPSPTVQLLRLIPNGQCDGYTLPNDFSKLKISVSTSQFDKGTFTPYHFRVRPYSKIFQIVEITSDKEIACKINNGACYMLLPLYSYDDISKLLLYANTPGKNDVRFYAKIIPATSFEECKDESCKRNLFPDSSDLTSERQENTKYFAFPEIALSKDKYVVIRVMSSTNDIVPIATSFTTYVESTVPSHNYLQLFNVRPGFSQRVLLDEYSLNITAIHLSGEGQFEFQKGKTYRLEKDVLYMEAGGKNDILTIKNIKNDKPLYFGLKYSYFKEKESDIKKIIIDSETGKNYKITSEESGAFSFNVTHTSNKVYAIMRTYINEIKSSAMHILYSSIEVPTIRNYQRASNLFVENLMVVRREEATNFYITVICPNKCDGKLTFYSNDYVHLEENGHFEFLGGGLYYNLAIKRTYMSPNDRIQVTLLGPQLLLEDKYMQIGIINQDGTYNEIDQPINGLLIKNTELSAVINPNKNEYRNSKYIFVRVGGPPGHYMRFISRYINNCKYFIGDPAMYVLKSKESYDIFKTECITILGGQKGKNYQFRLATTHAINITINGNITRNVSYMRDYIVHYTLDESEKSTLCFESVPTSRNYREVIETSKQAFYFQVITGENTLDSVIEPFYEGWIYTDHLGYDETRYYRHAKWTIEKTNAYIMSRFGTINALQVKCMTFPYCWNLEDMKNITKLIYAFSAFIGTIDPNDESHYGAPTQIIHLVHCIDKSGCRLRFEYIDQKELIRLRPFENHAKFINQYEIETYIIDPYINLTRFTKLEINFDVFHGDVVLKFENNENEIYPNENIFYGNAEKYIFDLKDIRTTIIRLKLISKTNAFYVISFRWIDEANEIHSIGESGLLLQAIKGEMTKIHKFRFWNSGPFKTDVPYVVNFIPINCELEVTRIINRSRFLLEPNELGQYEDISTINDKNHHFENVTSVYEVIFKQFKRDTPVDNNCYFYAGASESSQDIPTLLRESIPYVRTITKRHPNATFEWVFPYTQGDANIKINLNNEKRISTTLSVNIFDLPINPIFSKSTMLEISQSYLEECKYSSGGCPIILSINLNTTQIDDDEKVKIEVSFTTKSYTPSIIYKNVLRRSGSNDNSTNYFYFEVDKDEEGEIVLDFKRGIGTMFAKMISKYYTELNPYERYVAWRGKIALPNETYYDKELEYDSLHQKIRYNQAQTNKCLNKCFIVFGVKTRENMKSFQNVFNSEYNVLVRYMNTGVENLPKISSYIAFNELINGVLHELASFNYFHVYNLYIEGKYDGIEVEFKSLTATLYISWDREYQPISSCYIGPGKKAQLKKLKRDEACGSRTVPSSFTGKTIKFVVSTNNFEERHSSPYYFRVRPIYERIKHIIQLNSDKETSCQPERGNVNGYFCYYLVPLTSYDEISNVILYIDTEYKYDTEFYINVVSTKEYDSCGNEYGCIEKLIPLRNNNKLNNKGRYIILDGISYSKKDYILVTIEINHNEIISLYSSMKNYIHSTYPTPNQVQLVFINPSNQRIIQIDDSVKTIYLIPLKGKGYAKISDNEYELNDNDLTIQNKLVNASLAIKNNYTDNSFLVAIKYLLEPPPTVRKIYPESVEREQKIYSEYPTKFNFQVSSRGGNKYVILRTYVSHVSSGPLHLLMHPFEPPTKYNYQSGSNLYHENILVVRNDYTNDFFVTVYCPEKCNGKLSIYSSDHVHMKNNDHFEFVGSNDYYNLAIEKQSFSLNERIQLTLLSPQTKLDPNDMQIGIMNGNEISITDLPSSGLLIKDTELSCVINPSDSKYKDSKYIYIRVHGPIGQFMRFSTRTIGNSYYMIGDPAVYILKSDEKDLKENDCINFVGEKKGQIYQFRLVSTYGVTMYINNMVTKTLGYMSNYVQYYLVSEDNLRTTICFKANETTLISNTNIKTTKLALYFQVIDTDSNSMKAMLEPMYDGWKYIDKLKKGESRFYRFAKQTEYKTNVVIRSNKGTLNAFQVRCATFPYCSEPSEYQNVTKLINAFSAFVSTIDPNDMAHGGDPSQILHIVTCVEDDGCDFSILFNSPSDYTYLTQNQHYAKFIKANERETYIFKNSLENNENSIELSLDVFAGDAVIYLMDNQGQSVLYKYEHVFYGSSEKYILKQDDIKNTDIIFSVFARKNSYYVVSFRELVKESQGNDIGESGILLQYVNPDTIPSRYLQFFHNSPRKQKVSYISNIIPLNCEIDVRDESRDSKVNPNSLGEYEQISTYSTNHDLFVNHLPLYSVKFKKFIGPVPENKHCFFLVSSSESSPELPTLLREDFVYSRTLTVINKKASFVWPFPYRAADAMIKVNLKNEFRLNADVIVNNNTLVLSDSFSRSTILEIPKRYLEQCAFTEGCPITLLIEIVSNRDVEGFNVPIEVSLSTGRGTPQNLKKNEIRRGGFNDNTTNYYYIDIVKGEEGEIVLDFIRGGGIMFAKMVRDDYVNENINNWREKVILPTEKDYDKDLAYNYATQKIRFYKSHTDSCGLVCFIVVGVSSKFKFEGLETNFASEYTILVRNYHLGTSNLKENSISIGVNEFISGSLQIKNNYFEVYKLDFLDSYEGLEVEFKSNKAKLILSLNELDPKNECVISPSSQLKILLFKAPMQCGNNIFPTNLYLNTLYVLISTDTFEKEDFTPYYFRIRPVALGDRTHIIEINSDKETAVDAKENAVYHFMIPLYSWDGISNIILYANTNNDETNDVIFYARKVPSENFDKCSERECNQYLAKENDLNSERQENTKHLIIRGFDLSKSDYIMVAIKSLKDQIIPIVSSLKNFFSYTISRPNYAQLIYMYAPEKRYVELNDYVSQVKVKYIEGKGDIYINLFKYELPPLSPINALTYKTKSHIEIENTREGHFLIQLEYSYEKKPNITRLKLTNQKGDNQFFYSQGPEMFHYDVSVNTENKYAIFRTYSGVVDLGPMHIFMHEKEIPSPALYNLSSSLHHENVLAVKISENRNRHFYITVVCPQKCNGNLTYYASEYIHMNYNDHFEFVGGETYNLAFPRNLYGDDPTIQLVLLGPQINLNPMYLQIGYLENDQFKFKDDPSKGLLINDMELSYILHPNSEGYVGKYILVRVAGEKGHFMRFMSRHVGRGRYYIGEPAVYSIKTPNDMNNEECVDIYGMKTGEIYDFKLINTYSIQIYFITNSAENKNSVSKDNVLYMAEYTHELVITEKDFIPVVCFKSNPETLRDGHQFKTIKQAFYFQIIKRENSMQTILEPLYEGWIYGEKFQYGQSKFFRHAKWTAQNTNVYIQSRNGNINVYQVKCTTFPYCYDSTTYKNQSKIIYAFSAYVSSINHKEETHFGDSNQIIHIVKCLSIDGCYIQIRYYDTYNEIRFRENENHAKFLAAGETETYEFPVGSINNDNDLIEINLDVMAGDATINFDSERLKGIKHQFVFFGNSEKFIFDGKSVKDKLIKFWIRARTNSYYVVSHRYIESSGETSSIGENGFLLQSIRNKNHKNFDTERSFIFWHNNVEKPFVPYVSNLIPINCDIDVSYKNQKIQPNVFGFYEQSSIYGDELFKDNQPQFTVKFKKFNQKEPEDKMCYFYTGSSESSSDIPTLIRESMSYTRTLSEKFRSAFFVLPFPYSPGDVDIKLNMRNSYKIKANVTINDDLISETTFTRSALIEIPESSLLICEGTVGCPITIGIELAHLYELGNTTVPVEIVVSTSRKMPNVLPKGVLRRTALNINSTDYYYIEVSGNEEGEIILDFKRGTGIMFARLVRKDKNVENIEAWRKKVVLPNENFYDMSLPFNHITQKIRYEKKHTSKCDKVGCFLIVGVKSKENYGGFESIFTAEYNIYARYINTEESDLSKVAVNIPINDYIIGSLEQTVNKKQYDCYVLDILDDYDSLEIEYKGEAAKLVYNIGNEIKTNGNSIEPKKEFYLEKINDGQNKMNLKGNKLTITVSTSKLGPGNASPYMFKIRPIYKNKPHLVELNTDRQTICKANDNDVCNFYLPLTTYNGISELVFYADTKEQVTIYTSLTNADFFSNCDFEKCINDILPTRKKYIHTSENQENKNYLRINPSQYSKDDIILFQIVTKSDKYIPIVTSFKSYVNSTIPTPNSLQIVDINPGSKQQIIMSEYVKNFTVTLIQGKGKITYNNKEYEVNEKTKTADIYITSDKSDLTIINNDPQNNYILAFRYGIFEKKINPERPNPIDIDDDKPIEPEKPDKDKDKKQDDTGKKGGMSGFAIFIIFIIILAIVVGGLYKLLKAKQEKDTYTRAVNQLSITLSGQEVSNQPLIEEKDGPSINS